MFAHFSERRRKVIDAIGSGVLLLPSTPTAIRNNDVEHDFRQDSDLYYLSGFEEPNCALVLSGSAEQAFTLFVRPRDPEREVWDGARAGVEGAVADFGADAAFPIGDLSAKLPELLKTSSRLFYRLGRDRSFDDIVLRAIDRARFLSRRGGLWPTEIVDPATVVHEMRVLKSEQELMLMRRAIEISGEGHVEAMARSKPGMYEYEVDGLLAACFRRNGSARPAYGSIVGSGPNATVLHYRGNDRRMRDGDLLLIDAGCEYGYYASDITRTFPVNGRFTKEQRALYDIVLEAQLAAIDAVLPGATFESVHDVALRIIARGLHDLGIVREGIEETLAENRYKPYFMHRTGHYLGMDVHDVGAYYRQGAPRPLQPGMVVTVEPGIYVGAASEAPEAYRGIGIRIEDDVLVTATGAEVLSQAIPKHTDEIERVCTG
jgi:Xaa-Pro aminopeptidase